MDREEDIEEAAKCQVAGIGLFRTEFLFLAEGGEASEARQEEVYRHAARQMIGRPVTIRILDLAPDKVLLLSEDALQVRVAIRDCGVHYALAHPEILRPQLRAILRAAAEGDLKILLPAVTGVTEIDAFRVFLQKVAAELQSEIGLVLRHVPVGAMIETPAALFMLDAIAERADFLSLGTNDLLCHLFGSERREGKRPRTNQASSARSTSLSAPRMRRESRSAYAASLPVTQHLQRCSLEWVFASSA